MEIESVHVLLFIFISSPIPNPTEYVLFPYKLTTYFLNVCFSQDGNMYICLCMKEDSRKTICITSVPTYHTMKMQVSELPPQLVPLHVLHLFPYVFCASLR